MTNTLAIALIGAGRIGASHAALIANHPRARLALVIDPDQTAASRVADRHGAKIATWHDALSNPAIHAVLIASSTDTHATLIEDAARAGKAILSEKPIDLDLARIDRCGTILAETNARLMVGFNRRFDPHIMALKAQLDAGTIGPPSQLLLINRDANPPPPAFLRRSGGIFRDMALHDYDLACHLFGAHPIDIQAHGSALADADTAACNDFDTASTTLTMPNGAQAIILNSRCARFGFDYRLEILGAKGILRLDNPNPPASDFFARFETAFTRQLDAFVTAVLTNTPLTPSFAEGRAASAIAEAAAVSAAKEG